MAHKYAEDHRHWVEGLHLESRALHADQLCRATTDIAPPLHVSTTFHYPSDPDELEAYSKHENAYPPQQFIYARHASSSIVRLESILSSTLRAPSLTYSSGLSAIHGIYMALRPKHVFITGGYHGVYGVLEILRRIAAGQAFIVKELAESESSVGTGDVIHVETPINPTGEAIDLAHYAQLAHQHGAFCVVDATFGPPPLQDPFLLGADFIMHSGTKYIGGHSDLLLGVVAIKDPKWFETMANDRHFSGSVPGNMESWLAQRSLRTLQVRVRKQSVTATELVKRIWQRLHERAIEDQSSIQAFIKVFHSVRHSSIQFKSSENKEKKLEWLAKQMPEGLHSPVFALVCQSEEYARRLPSKLKIFSHATSLGGVESLIEWRAMSDTTVDRRLMRLSIGLEHVEDLWADIAQAAIVLAKETTT